MKFGQALSFYGIAFPPESLALLALLQDSAAAVPFATMQGVRESELGRRTDDVFAYLDDVPLAVGSMGQVHRGRLRTGEDVVVKIQFPGIRERLERDFRALRIVLPLATRFLPTWDLQGILDELRRQMRLECDYRLEAKWQLKFRARLEDDSRVVIPRVHESLSTSRVLVSDYFDGQTFSEFVKSADQARRNWAGEILLHYMIRTAIVDRSFNTDMHPGNLLFAEDRICLVDFGNVREWNHVSKTTWFEFFLGLANGDRTRTERAMSQLGFLPEGRGQSVRDLFPETALVAIMKALTSDGPAARHSKDVRLDEATRVPLTPTYIYGARMYYGTFAILADLGAEISFRRTAVDTVARYADADVRAEVAGWR
jgi:predicted unusual protein kinase regulating ubiquinone biosynthesis (AarF/ABC1/UbiB family)